ncbi:hypothetical protein Q9233_014189 [Columba guinea]|nr:hypothetical protein Q9233_014189 [Columba guinea]
MATRGLLEMLDAAFRTPRVAVVDLVALHELLKAMIIGQEGQQELSFLEPGQSLTHGLAKDQESKKQPGQEKEEDGALGTGQQPRGPQEQLDGKDTLEGTGSNSGVTSMAKEAMPKTTEDEERDVSKADALAGPWVLTHETPPPPGSALPSCRPQPKGWKRASLQDLWEEINKFKEALCGLAEDMRAMQKAHSGMAEDMREMQEAMQKAHSGMAQDIQEMKETLGLRGSFSSQATIPGDAQEPAKPWHCSGSTITSSYELEMQEVLSQAGQLGHLCTGLKDQVEQLKSAKAERADLEDVHRLFPKGGRQSITSILSYLKCQMSFLQDMARTLHGEEEQIRKVEDAPRKTRGSGADRKADGSGQMTQQPRPKGQKDEPWVTVHIGGHEQAGCHVCSPDTMVLLGKLLQRCEKLKEQVESLAQKAGRKVESHPMWRRQSLQQDEQLKRLQTSIMQLQKDYEKLSSALANLQHDRQQEQDDIKALGRLNKQKADKEELQLLGIDEKADKATLADKVSCSQFEACVERLNEMMEEVTSRVTGQEKGWQRFQQELQRQMDCKVRACPLHAALAPWGLGSGTLRGLMMLKMSCLVETMPSSPPLRLLGARGQRQESREEET